MLVRPDSNVLWQTEFCGIGRDGSRETQRCRAFSLPENLRGMASKLVSAMQIQLPKPSIVPLSTLFSGLVTPLVLSQDRAAIKVQSSSTATTFVTRP
jgi:hypothetical protein